VVSTKVGLRSVLAPGQADQIDATERAVVSTRKMCSLTPTLMERARMFRSLKIIGAAILTLWCCLPALAQIGRILIVRGASGQHYQRRAMLGMGIS